MADNGTPAVNSTCPLAEYIRKDYERKRANRKHLEDKWLDNYNAFMAIAEGKWKVEEGEGWRSKSVINITKQKVMTAYAIIIDLVLSGGKIPFALKRSELDEELSQLMGESVNDEQIEANIETMKARIDTQLSETKSDRAFAANILSCCLYGEAIGKVGIDTIRSKQWRKVLPDTGFDMSRIGPQSVAYEQIVNEHKSPAWMAASIWDIFRDLEFDQPRDGRSVIHRQFKSPYWLRQKKGRPYFIDENIRRVLNSLPSQDQVQSNQIADADVASLPPSLRKLQFRENVIRYLEFSGRVPAKTVEAFEQQLATENPSFVIEQVGKPATDEAGDEVYILACEANGQIVRYSRITEDEIKYWRAVCEQAPDDNEAIGVADNVASMQLVINGAFRAFEDNKKQSGNVQRAVKPRFLERPNDLKSRTPGQDIVISDDCDDVRKAISAIVTPDVGETLLSVIDMGLRMADNDSMIPRIAQGLEPENKDNTALQIAKQMAQAGKYIGALIRNLDEGLIEPIINEFLDHNMEDPEVQEGKGDYVVQALGFSSYNDKVDRIARIQQFIAFALSDPDLRKEIKFRAPMEDSARALDIDDDRYLKSDDEKAREAEAAAQGQQDPVVTAQLQKIGAEVEKMTAESQAALKKMELEQVRVIADIEQKKLETATLEQAKPAMMAGKVNVTV